ncbi:MAG: CDP-glucose 4,6-dehydratase [Epsilonproteobacteria bacterium]|nr:MAG: CDP-glucose 4,6-dehydratase [Campylobacterota bacterium]
MTRLFNSCYLNKIVLITGHTGFKGSWLVYWLTQMGAKVIGYSLEAPTTPNHIELLDLDIISIVGDIRDLKKLNKTFKKYQPDIVFHLGAQALVRASYKNPIETYETNIIGTLKVFEACRKNGVKAVVNITSDKAYENIEQIWGYKENDSMGGYDPYSSSKGCSELLTSSYRNSYFNLKTYAIEHNTLLASCRAGNVIGGGDWAEDRLIPDIMTSISKDKKVTIRNPKATRPWQHVLEPLSGYLNLGQYLLEEKVEYADGWNFAPSCNEDISVEDILKNVKKYWSKLDYTISKELNQPHEANLLKLDSSKANLKLNWNSVWDSDKTVKRTVRWYKKYYEKHSIETKKDLQLYVRDAKVKGMKWAIN